jgi:hypothetical protein
VIPEQEGRTGSAQKLGGGRQRKVAQTMYTHESKCKNDKIKRKKSLHTELKKRITSSRNRAFIGFSLNNLQQYRTLTMSYVLSTTVDF